MTSPATVQAKPEARSRIGNGKALLPDVDGRSGAMRRYKEILARRAATLAVWCEGAEGRMANGEALEIAPFTTAANTLRRLLADLGLERRMKDVTPTLQQYLAGREKPE